MLEFNMIETHPFGNFIPSNIKYLLLGSFTAKSVDSDTEYDWFYASKRNQFWPIIEKVYNIDLHNKSSKVKLYENLSIGIADIIYQCERRNGSSLDNNLVNIVYNPELERILQCKLKSIFFTSRFVEKLYRKAFKKLIEEFTTVELITLPSPSPRYAAMSKEEKISKYKELLPELKPEHRKHFSSLK